jgi:hypothetical protein
MIPVAATSSGSLIAVTLTDDVNKTERNRETEEHDSVGSVRSHGEAKASSTILAPRSLSNTSATLVARPIQTRTLSSGSGYLRVLASAVRSVAAVGRLGSCGAGVERAGGREDGDIEIENEGVAESYSYYSVGTGTYESSEACSTPSIHDYDHDHEPTSEFHVDYQDFQCRSYKSSPFPSSTPPPFTDPLTSDHNYDDNDGPPMALMRISALADLGSPMLAETYSDALSSPATNLTTFAEIHGESRQRPPLSRASTMTMPIAQGRYHYVTPPPHSPNSSQPLFTSSPLKPTTLSSPAPFTDIDPALAPATMKPLKPSVSSPQIQTTFQFSSVLGKPTRAGKMYRSHVEDSSGSQWRTRAETIASKSVRTDAGSPASLKLELVPPIVVLPVPSPMHTEVVELDV